MTAFFALTKQLIKNTLIPNFKDAKEKKKYIITLIVIAVCLGIPYIMMLVGIFGLVKASVELGYIAQILSIGFFASQLLTFFFGLFAYVNIMYFSKDNEFLFTLPLKSVSIFWAKFISILVYEMIFSVCTVIPVCIVALIAMASLGSFSVGILLMMIPATVLLPLMAILVIALLSFPIMKILQFFKKRPIFGAIVTVLLVAAIYIAIYVPIIMNTPDMGGSELESGVVEDVGEEISMSDMYAAMLPSIASIGKYFYHTYLLALSMTAGGVKAFGYAMAFIGIVVALAALGTLLAMWQFKRISQGVYESNGVASSKKQGEIKQTSLKKALLKKEFSSVLKSSNLLIQSGMMVILPPVLIFLLGKYQVKLTNSFVALAISELIIKLMTSSNTISLLAVSRDGEGALMAKTMPISANQIVWSKIFSGFVFSAITVTLSTIALAIIGGGINVVQVLGFFISNMIYAWAVNRYCVYRDLKKPKVHWKNIEEIIKNNFSSVIPMFLAFIPGLLVMAPTMAYGLALTLNPYVIAAIYLATTLAVSGVYSLIINATTKGNVEEYWQRIE